MSSARSIRARAKRRSLRVTMHMVLPESLTRHLMGMTTIERENIVAAALRRFIKEQS